MTQQGLFSLHIDHRGSRLEHQAWMNFQAMEKHVSNPPLVGIAGQDDDGGQQGAIKMVWMNRVVWLAVVACGAFNARADSALPQRNLLVEWRMSASSEQQNQGAGLRSGELTVDSRGGMVVRGNGVVSASTRSSSSSGMQQLQVLNGGQARLYLGTSRPVSQWQFGLSGTGTAAPSNSNPNWQAWQSTTMVDTGRGLTVRPRWTGGQHVTVELEARVAQQTPYAPDGQTDSSEVMTTVRMPLGQWTAVAQRGGQTQQRQRGVLSTDDISRGDNEVLEMRVSVP
jgi:hypothetical protein